MKNQMKKIIQEVIARSLPISVAILLVMGVTFVKAWTEPTVTPPGGSVTAPLNTGDIGQIKDGGLTLGATSSSLDNGLIVKKGRTLLGQFKSYDEDNLASFDTGASANTLVVSGLNKDVALVSAGGDEYSEEKVDLEFYRAFGDINNPQSVRDGANLGQINFHPFFSGLSGNGWGKYTNRSASIRAYVDGLATATSLPTRIEFATSPVGSITTDKIGGMTPRQRIVSMVIKSTGNVGIGAENPGTDKLDVRGRAYASGGWQTVDADYAEWFEREETASAGDIIGINLETGKVRKYRPGDKFVGIYSANPAFVGNRTRETDEEMAENNLLVGLLGQLEFNQDQVVIKGRIVETFDGQEIGVILSNGKILIGR